MHDLRRQALESGKTVSKKARSKTTSLSNSKTNSRTTSRNTSRNPSRNNSDDEEDDIQSDSTNWSINSIGDDDDDEMLYLDMPDDTTEAWKQDLGDRMEEIIDKKRSSTQGREMTLQSYIQTLMSRYVFEEIQVKTSELYPALLKSTKADSSEREASLALRAIALTTITCPSDHIYESLLDPLKVIYTDSEHPSVKAAALHTLGAVTTYGGASDADIEEVMDEFLEIIESDGVSIGAEDSCQVVAAACQVWGYLATLIEDIQERTETAMEAFVEQLESADKSVLIAAGENIALLYEKSHTKRERDDPRPKPKEDAEGFPVDQTWVKRYDAYRKKGELEHIVSQLANESSRRMSKKDRRALHVNFTDILNTIEVPSRGPRYQRALHKETGKRYGTRLTIRIQGKRPLVINKWWRMHRLQELRRILGGGFMEHYRRNVNVEDSFPKDEPDEVW